jgi:hypothetical protein
MTPTRDSDILTLKSINPLKQYGDLVYTHVYTVFPNATFVCVIGDVTATPLSVLEVK